MSWCVSAAKTKYHSLGGLNNRHLFLIILPFTLKFKVKVPADLILGE
jgi:hypothetical protein